MFRDPGERNLMGQMALHAEMCDDSNDCITHQSIPNVHHTPDFVLWHRAFLFFHEQILSALGNGPVGLPYWDWSSDRLCPPAFDAAKFDFGKHLAHSTNELGDENFAQEQILGVVAALRSLPPAEAAMQLFDEPIHTLVHGRFGWGRRSDLTTAAGDPAFYGHHGNLDRLATHIFEKGWPAPSGINYHFIGTDNKPICTKIDQFSNMASPYAGDGPIDTSGFEVRKMEDLRVAPPEGYSRVRTRLRFSAPLSMGLYQLHTNSGVRVGEIASIHHHGGADFTVWLTTENYAKARSEGLKTAPESTSPEITGALLVTKTG